MSRSIHTTWRDYIREKRNSYSDIEYKNTHLSQMQKEIRDKQLIKKRKKLERKLEDVMFDIHEDIDLSSIDIRVLDSGEYIHYIAKKEDLIGVAKRLPRGVLLGINSINFCLGKEYHDEDGDYGDFETRDPYTGRICCESNGPMYISPVRGSYYPDTCKIFLYAFVYDRKELTLEIIESFLRLQTLATFIHEVAHHDDNMRRKRRGRWLGLNEWKCEDYAYLQQMEWAEKSLVPYLLDEYPDEYPQLLSWIKEYGGVDFSLIELTGEAKAKKIVSASSAIEELFANVINNKSACETMLEFAKDLHLGDYYEQCLGVLDTLLGKFPKDAEALGVKADTLVHMEKYSEAEAAARECLEIDMYNINALDTLCDVQKEAKDWHSLKKISLLGIQAAKDDSWKLRLFLEARILASLYLREYKDVIESIAIYPEDGRHKHKKQAYKALLLLVNKDARGALNLAKDILVQDKILAPAGAILKAVYNKAIDKLGEKSKKYVLSDYERGYLTCANIAELLEM